jgi:hypothetical protein
MSDCLYVCTYGFMRLWLIVCTYFHLTGNLVACSGLKPMFPRSTQIAAVVLCRLFVAHSSPIPVTRVPLILADADHTSQSPLAPQTTCQSYLYSHWNCRPYCCSCCQSPVLSAAPGTARRVRYSVQNRSVL